MAAPASRRSSATSSRTRSPTGRAAPAHSGWQTPHSRPHDRRPPRHREPPVSNGTKTDNRSLELKLKIRRWTLGLAKLEGLRILDLCAGEGRIWKAMRQHAEVLAYTPCDRAPRAPGTIRGDATDPRFLAAFDYSKFNVIDVDTYGEPWDTWGFQIGRAHV